MKLNLRHILRPSLAMLFFRYYLTALVALVLIISVVGVVIDQIYNGLDEDTGRNFMRGTVVMLQQELQEHPEAQWDHVLATLAPSFSYKVSLTDLSHLQTLDDNQRQDVSRGITHMDMDELVIYARVGDSQRVLALGPLNFTPNDSDSLLTDGTHAKVLWWMLTGLGFGILVFLAIRPLWDDLVTIRGTAERLAAGDLAARAPIARSWLLAPLSLGLNSMADRLQSQMSSQQALSLAVSHELRTPIARLRFGLTMLEDAASEAEARKYRENMERDMQELDDLVNASMSYAQLDQGDVVLQWEHTELYDWFADLLELVRPLATPGLKFSLACPRIEAEFDRKLMYVATRNLLVNALRYARSAVRLKVDKQEGWLEIMVDDDGPGVPMSERERIFAPFHRLDVSRERHGGSYGLGLSFVRLIAEHHGGGVSVADSPDGGARFIIRIPSHDNTEETI